MSGFPSIVDLISGLRGLDSEPADGLQLEKHLTFSLGWIKQAYSATRDGGISKGYDLIRGRWAPSYPETTGYTIPTLLNAAMMLDEFSQLQALAGSMADYLLENTTPEGGVAHWQADAERRPIVFDTGQVIFGWLALYEAIADERCLRAAAKAGDWLVAVQAPSGAWTRYQHLDVVKVIDTRVAWALLKLHQYTQQDRYRRAAVTNLTWALTQQDADGWFRACSFTPSEDPFTHTLAYAVEGLLECGMLLAEERFVKAARHTADALLARQDANGKLASTFGPRWRPTSHSSCLTGNCQMAIVWLRLYETSGESRYLSSAQRAVSFVARTQRVQAKNAGIRGAIAGSYPIYGRYERFKYPNWAAKFFVDALLTLRRVKSNRDIAYYAG